jgi:hypothetical protein
MPAGRMDPLTEPIRASHSDLADMIKQVQSRIQHRTVRITRTALVNDSEWKRNLVDRFGPNVVPDDATNAICHVAIYRDRWGIDDSPLPLGPVPDPHKWEQQQQRTTIDRLVDQAALSSASHPQVPTWTNDPAAFEDRLINVGWQL